MRLLETRFMRYAAKLQARREFGNTTVLKWRNTCALSVLRATLSIVRHAIRNWPQRVRDTRSAVVYKIQIRETCAQVDDCTDGRTNDNSTCFLAQIRKNESHANIARSRSILLNNVCTTMVYPMHDSWRLLANVSANAYLFTITWFLSFLTV